MQKANVSYEVLDVFGMNPKLAGRAIPSEWMMAVVAAIGVSMLIILSVLYALAA